MEMVSIEVPRQSALARGKVRESHHISNLGLGIAAVAVAPLIAFALLWTAVLAALGGMWLLSVLGLI